MAFAASCSRFTLIPLMNHPDVLKAKLQLLKTTAYGRAKSISLNPF